MDEKALKTSPRQRIIIALIAILLLGSTIAAYAGIIVSGSKSSDLSSEQTAYQEAVNTYNEYGTTLSSQYFDTFNSYRSNVKAYNAEAANGEGVKTTDLLVGDGRELAADDTNYFAYYIGICPDGSTFDTSFDNFDNPTSLSAPIYAGQGLIQGWNEGVVGMKLGGVREIQMPGELAYGDSREICGSTNSPLKFIVMAITDDKLSQLANKVEEAYAAYAQAYYKSQQATQSQTTTTQATEATQTTE